MSRSRKMGVLGSLVFAVSVLARADFPHQELPHLLCIASLDGEPRSYRHLDAIGPTNSAVIHHRRGDGSMQKFSVELQMLPSRVLEMKLYELASPLSPPKPSILLNQGRTPVDQIPFSIQYQGPNPGDPTIEVKCKSFAIPEMVSLPPAMPVSHGD